MIAGVEPLLFVDGSDGALSDKLEPPPVQCIECGEVCSDFYCAVFLKSWRFFCVRHAKALARRQYRYADRRIREATAHG